MATLTGSTQPVTLAPGYSVRAPGITGTAEVKLPRDAATRARSREVEDGTSELDAALDATSMTEVRQIELQLASSPPPGDTRALRSAHGQEMLEVAVPDFGAEYGHLVLSCDEAGALTWHLPEPDEQADAAGATRGAGAQKRFRIPATRPAQAPDADPASRGLIGILGRKLLKVLVYPLVDPVIGALADHFAEKWERSRRPYGLRHFSPEDFRTPITTGLEPAVWTQLSGKRALLFVHGTFSTAHSAFSGLDDDTFRALYDTYDGRVFAFNHFTLSHDPARNVRWFLEQVPAGSDVELDIVCHSRGGLVARMLAERPASFGLPPGRVKVRRIVFVGVPNNGTLLAHPDHMVSMIDRFTTALNLFPTGPVTETLEALITVIKVIGHGALKSLDGLASMHPEGAFLAALNQGEADGAAYHALAADYEPADQGLKTLISGTLADAALDRIFQDVANDLVVPEPGVYAANGSGAFPIDDVRRKLQLPASSGVMHTTFFGSREVREQLLRWLQ